MARPPKPPPPRPRPDPRPSRPPPPAPTRLASRRRAMLDAATAVFLERGYAAATLDEVIARSGGSRSTLFKLFGSKEGLLAAIVEETSEALDLSALADGPGDAPPEEALRALAARFLAALRTPAALGLHRLAIAEAPQAPALGRAFWERGPARSVDALARYLGEQSRCGVLSIADPRAAAERFFGLVQGLGLLRGLLGVGDGWGEPEAAGREAVAIFLDGCRAPAAAGLQGATRPAAGGPPRPAV